MNLRFEFLKWGRLFPLLAILLWQLPGCGRPTKPKLESVAEPAPQLSAEEAQDMREQFAIFQAEGLSPKGREALENIGIFSDEHPEVNIVFNLEATPWVMTKVTDAPVPDLMSVFIAGNIRAMLSTGNLQTNSYAGTLEVLRIYAEMKAENPELEIPELETFILMDRKGKLREMLDKIDRRPAKPKT